MNSLVIFILLFFSILSCNNGEKIEVQRPLITGATIIEVSPEEVDVYYKTSGTVVAKIISDIASRVMGTVTSIQVKEGDRVSKGQLLLTIDNRDLINKVKAEENGLKELLKVLEAAKQNKHLANITYDRYKKLYGERAISKQEMDEMETKKRLADIEFERAGASLEKGKAKLEELRINLDFTRVKSPIDGIVTEKNIEVGNTAVPGMNLLKVEDDSSFRLETMVDEKLLGQLQIGTPANLHINALNRDTKGKILEIVPSIDPSTRTFLIKIDLASEEKLRTGLYAKVLIPYSKRIILLVPEEAIVEKGQLTGIYTLDDEGIVNYRLIRVGPRFNRGVEVLSGLKKGDRIIVDGLDNVTEGGIIKNN